MAFLQFNPALKRPLTIHSLSDAVTSMFAEMAANPEKFGSEQQLRNLYFLVKRTENAICDALSRQRETSLKSREIYLNEVLNLDADLLVIALEEGVDPKHAGMYGTGTRKIIAYATGAGWSCDAIMCMEAWAPIEQALFNTTEGTLQLVQYLIAAGRTPAQTTEADLLSWHAHATKDGMLPATADRILTRFRGRIRLAGLEHLFPHLNLKSKRPTSYYKKEGDWEPAIRAEIENLVATRAPIYLPGRDARKALRPASLKSAVQSVCAIYGCLEGQLNLGPFTCLAEMFTTTNLCDSIDWLNQHGLKRQSIHRILAPILALAEQFPNLDCRLVRNRIKQIPREPDHQIHARKQAKSLPYDELSVISQQLQKRIDDGGRCELDIAWFLHDKALISILHRLLLRQLNLRESKLPSPGIKDANLVWEILTPQMMHDLIIPNCVRAAYDADPLHTRRYLMLKFNEKQTKGKRAQIEVLALDLAAIVQAFLEVRARLLEQINAKRKKPEPNPDPGTLFFNRLGRAMKEHNLRSHVLRLTRNYVGKAIPPHFWRDIYAAHFRMLLALGVEKDPTKLSVRLWHINQQTTDKYNHLNKGLAAIAMLNKQYRAS